MKYSSDVFAMQANSDLRQAQAIARTDRAGYALGVVMYLVQQCVEKILKSILLKLVERMNLQDAQRFMPESRGHQIYRDAHSIHADYIESHTLPFVPPGRIPAGLRRSITRVLGRNHAVLGWADAFWSAYLEDPSWQLLSWKHSLHAASESELGRLRSLNDTHMPAYTLVGDQAVKPASEILNLQFSGIRMCETVYNARLLSEARARHRSYLEHRRYREAIARTFDACNSFLRPGARESLSPVLSGPQYSQYAKRLFLEYGFSVFMYYALAYQELLPHNTYGRYPVNLGGTTTADVYESRPDHVLFYAFVDTPYHVGQLGGLSSRIDRLWEAGGQNGCW